MSKKLFVGFLLLLLGFGAYSFLTRKNINTPVRTNSKASIKIQTTPTPGQYNGNLGEIFGNVGSSRFCTFSNKISEENSVEGTYYVGENAMRGDFTVAVDNEISKSHIIVLGRKSYTWKDGEDKGIESFFGSENLKLLKSPDPVSGTDTPETSFNCDGWEIDLNFFSLPKNIDFVPDDLVKQQNEQCAECDALSGVQRVECLKKLSCTQ